MLILTIPTYRTLQPRLISFDQKEVNCLALAIYHEARGEILAGQYAIAKTVINRAKDPRFPNTICKVVYQPGQFTDVRKTKIRDMASWQRALDVAYNVLNMQGNYSFKGLYFHTKYINPGWNKKPIARIGNHVFYT